MTLEEVLKHIASGNKRPLFLEQNERRISSRSYPLDWSPWLRIWAVHERLNAIDQHYNVTFRFWWEEPNADESAAAKWQDEKT